PQNRTGDTGAYDNAVCRLGDSSQDRPDERTVALRGKPWVKVVRNGNEVETGILSLFRQPNEPGWGHFFARECESEGRVGPASLQHAMRWRAKCCARCVGRRIAGGERILDHLIKQS